MPLDLDTIVHEIANEITANAAAIEAEADAGDNAADAPGPFGIAILTVDGRLHAAGAADTGFPLQSISKVFALHLAMEAIGDRVFARVGREPSGDPFNSIVDLERNDGIPRNPFINAGALLVSDILVGEWPDDRQAGAVVEFVRRELGADDIALDEDVLASEHESGHLNRAMMSFACHHGNLHEPIDDVMEAYVRQCAITVDCRQLVRAGRFLAETRRPHDDPAAAARVQRIRRTLSLMMTCGHYDSSGDFAWRVGLPAKSGVGGGILAVMPGVATIATWSPNLDQHGNSILGVRGLEMVSHRTDWSVFAGPADAGHQRAE